jgi:hypothetical protein
MNITIDQETMMAIEIRRSCFGYAVFQGSKWLLDWGATTRYPLSGAIQRAEKRLLFLLRMLHPVLVVIRRPCQSAPRGPILSLLKRLTAEASVPIFTLTQDEVRQAFSRGGFGNKYHVAEALAGIFPDLIFKLPPKRGTGDSERHAMIVFDAIATGYAHLQRTQMGLPPTE